MIEEMTILRRMVRLLPPGCGQARRDREKQLGGGRQNFAHSLSARRSRTVHGHHRGLRNDGERMDERICRKLKLAVSAAYLLTRTPVNFVSAGTISRRSPSTASSSPAGCATRRSARPAARHAAAVAATAMTLYL